MNTYYCAGFRSVKSDGINDAATVFAGRAARREFGRRGTVTILREDSWSEDFTLVEYDAFIGFDSGRNETTGRNFRFTVTVR